MTALYVLDVPENVPVAEVAAADPAVTVSKIGPYFEITADGVISIDRRASGHNFFTPAAGFNTLDRRATGCRHAVWYSSVAGLRGARITQHDKDALRVEPG
jgi:hypothetical protein